MRSNPKIAVALSCYNQYQYLGQAVRSIINQTYDDWKLIIFLNNSTDSSERIARYFQAQNPKIEVVNFNFVNKVLPVGVARYLMMNYCFNYDYDLITILDADDFWREDKLEKQTRLYKMFSQNKLIFSDCYYYYQKKEIEQIDAFPVFVENYINYMRLKTFHEKYPPLMSNPFKNLLLKYNFMPCPTLMFEREALQSVIGNPMHYTSAEDYDWIIKMTRKFKCNYVPEPLAYYRIHSNQLTRRTSWRCTMEEIDVFRRFMKFLPKQEVRRHLFWFYCKLIYKEIYRSDIL